MRLVNRLRIQESTWNKSMTLYELWLAHSRMAPVELALFSYSWLFGNRIPTYPILPDPFTNSLTSNLPISQSTKYVSQQRRPVAVNLNGDFVSQLPIISDFVKSAKGWSIFAKSRARHEWIESLESDFISESIVEFPIMSNPAGFLAEFDPEYKYNPEPALCSTPYAISCGIHGDSRPASTKVAYNLSLLPHFGMVAN